MYPQHALIFSNCVFLICRNPENSLGFSESSPPVGLPQCLIPRCNQPELEMHPARKKGFRV